MNSTIAIQIAREVRYKKRKTLLKIGTRNLFSDAGGG